MHNNPPLGVLKFLYKLQHMDTRRAKPLKNHQRTTPQNHSRFLNFDLENVKNEKGTSPGSPKSVPRQPLSTIVLMCCYLQGNFVGYARIDECFKDLAIGGWGLGVLRDLGSHTEKAFSVV